MIGRVLYAALFCVVLPAALWAWSRGIEIGPAVPVVRSYWGGLAALVGGGGLMAWGMASLWRYGGGLPMNAYPPPRRASRGAFAVVSHPIYVGFVVACCGAALASGSKAGLWGVTPLAALGCAALVAGYEGEDLKKRVGRESAGERPWLSLVGGGERPPTWRERVAPLVFLLIPWLVMYEALGHVQFGGGVETWTAIDRQWRVWTWTEAVYAMAYPMVVAAPLLVRSRAALRRFEVRALVAMAAAFWCYLTFPLWTPPKAFDGGGLFGWMLGVEQADGLDGYAAFPSFHVAWVMIAAAAMTEGWRSGCAAWGLAAAISASCVTTGMHSVADVIGGMAIFLLAHRAGDVWRWVLSSAERIANGWTSWRVGPARILIHAVYAGLAALVGAVVCLVFLGGSERWGFVAVGVGALVGAGVWGQVLEGSGSLSRPFGYYGHVLGAAVSLGVVWMVRGECWTLLGALATAAPWVQAFGRVRCLVQGCCHGRAAEGGCGIRYVSEKSRVCALSDLGGREIHATQVYSIVWNVAIGGPLAAWSAHGASAAVVAGLYLVLSGLGRFVEESYRGEPQTRVWRGLHSYQWLAVASVVIGGWVMTQASPAMTVRVNLEAEDLAVIGGLALVYAAAMGVDFPASSRRLARLGPP